MAVWIWKKQSTQNDFGTWSQFRYKLTILSQFQSVVSVSESTTQGKLISLKHNFTHSSIYSKIFKQNSYFLEGSYWQKIQGLQFASKEGRSRFL